MSYGTDFIDIPITKPYRVGRTFTKMSNNKSTQPEVTKTKAKYSKTRGEHAKDVIIAILIAGVIAFIGGMYFANQQHAEMQTAVKAAQLTTVTAPSEVKK